LPRYSQEHWEVDVSSLSSRSVIKAKGSKMVILKNVQEKKFASILLPICKALIVPEQQHFVSFDR
jgi:hypothetical protein